jgi:hypothetical protein
MNQRRLASGPLIARLVGRNRMTINAAMRAGRYGETVVINEIRYADLANVEAARGIKFSPEQLTAAVAGKADRLLTINPETEAA